MLHMDDFLLMSFNPCRRQPCRQPAACDREHVEKAKEAKGSVVSRTESIRRSRKSPSLLDEWIRVTGGNVVVVIDDGGHRHCHIETVLLTKFGPPVKTEPGGLYFIKDLHVGKAKK